MASAANNIVLGILAGGRASRLGGVDKAWLRRDGTAQVQRLAACFSSDVDAVLVSANRHHERYGACGLRTVADRTPDIGPLAGLDALAQACDAPWLLTIPVDIVSVGDRLLPALAAADGEGAYAVDDDGVQPLVALWRVGALRAGVGDAIASGSLAAHALLERLRMAPVRLTGTRFGNLNTPQDLTAAGFELP